MKNPPLLKMERTVRPSEYEGTHTIVDDTIEHCLAGIMHEAKMIVMHNDAEVEYAGALSIPWTYVEALKNIERMAVKVWGLLPEEDLR